MHYDDFAGHSVLDIQKALAAHGFSPDALDGKMGPSTKAAIEEFQRVAGLPVDGTVGPATESALFAPASSPTASPVHDPSEIHAPGGAAPARSGPGLTLPILLGASVLAILFLKR